MRTSTCLACAAATTVALAAIGEPTLATYPGANGTIVFQRNAGGREDDHHAQVFALAPDGAVRQLTHLSGGAFQLTWSPNGSRIAFARYLARRDGDQLFSMDPDGSDIRAIAHDCNRARRCLGDDWPSYSPDARRIAFFRTVALGASKGNAEQPVRFDLMVVAASGGKPLLLKRFGSGLQPGYGPARWSPDGKTIALALVARKRASNPSALHVFTASGRSPRRITPWTLNAARPDWSPDGSRIAFQSDVGHTSSIDVVGADGGDVTQLLAATDARTGTGPASGYAPSWSPDGKQIAFAARPKPSTVAQADIYAMNADGTNVHPLVAGPDAESYPAWGAAPAATGGTR